jgi:alpha-beta hydrolase superfamily lysophospholipase
MNWLILRGLVREQRHWGEFALQFEAGLKEKDPGAKVFMLDFAGFGTESDRFSPTTIDGIVDDLRARWSAVSASGEWCLLAVSLGGMVAMNWTSRYPDDFKKLVLINSSVGGLSPLFRRMQPANIPTILSLFFEKNIRNREARILSITTNLKGDALQKRADWQGGFAKVVRPRDAAAQIFAAIRFRAPARISIPVLVLTSKGDTLVHYSCSESIARHFGAELRAHETANHDLPTDDPNWVCSQVRDWS